MTRRPSSHPTHAPTHSGGGGGDDDDDDDRSSGGGHHGSDDGPSGASVGGIVGGVIAAVAAVALCLSGTHYYAKASLPMALVRQGLGFWGMKALLVSLLAKLRCLR